jgi:hypothetical protein
MLLTSYASYGELRHAGLSDKAVTSSLVASARTQLLS